MSAAVDQCEVDCTSIRYHHNNQLSSVVLYQFTIALNDDVRIDDACRYQGNHNGSLMIPQYTIQSLWLCCNFSITAVPVLFLAIIANDIVNLTVINY